jgi:hypothetical protein
MFLRALLIFLKFVPKPSGKKWRHQLIALGDFNIDRKSVVFSNLIARIQKESFWHRSPHKNAVTMRIGR